jgi:hypothetical protein
MLMVKGSGSRVRTIGEVSQFVFFFLSEICYRRCESVTLLTTCGRVLPETTVGFQLVKKFALSSGTQRFITVFTRGRHFSLYRASCIPSAPVILVILHFSSFLPRLTPASLPVIMSLNAQIRNIRSTPAPN